MTWFKITTPSSVPPMAHGTLSRHVIVYDGFTQIICFFDHGDLSWNQAHGVSDEPIKPTHWKYLDPNPTT